MKKILLTGLLAGLLSLGFVGCAEIEEDDDDVGVGATTTTTTQSRTLRAY
jgi:hypothetical protein